MGVNLNELKVVNPETIEYESDTITFDAIEGDVLRIETSPDGEEIASGTVPSGKKWTIQVAIFITESDA